MKYLMVVLTCICLAHSAQALPETQLQPVYDLIQADSPSVSYEQNGFLGAGDILISYMKMGKSKGMNGTLVIVPGRTEAALQYTETAMDFIAKGFSPVYILDLRGQGFSGRELKDSQKGYVENFADYVDDFHIVTQIAFQDPNTDTKNFFVIAHSLGGAIVTSYLENYDSPYTLAALVSPMHKIKLDESEDATLKKTWMACYLPFGGGCDAYVPDGGPYKAAPLPSGSTLSKYRHKLIQWISKTYPEVQLGSATVKWVRESILANQEMRKKKNVAKIQTPFMILQAKNDATVDNAGQDEVCSYTKLCTKIVFSKADHKLPHENDNTRNQVMSSIESFFLNY